MTATKEMLSNSEIRYKFLIDSIPDVIGELDLDGTINFISSQVYDMLGYHPDEMIGTNVIKFIHPDDVPRVTKALKKAVKSKKVVFPNLRLKHEKGYFILVFARGRLIKLDGKDKLIGVMRDITKSSETEKKLEKSQDFFKQLNEVFMKFKEDPIFNLQLLINTAGLLLNADCAFFNILKRVEGKGVLESLVTYNEPPNFTRVSDPKGQICTDIIKDNPDDVVILNNLDKSNYVKTDENVLKYDLKQCVSYVVRFNNKPTATFCVVYTENREMSKNDISLLKILSKSASTELARWNSVSDLQKSEEKYRRLINNLSAIILELDIKGTVIYVSPQCYNIMGYQPAEIIGKNFMGFLHPDDINLIAKVMKQAVKTKEVISVPSYRLIHKNGDYIYASANGRYVNISGDEKFVVAIRDERESKNLEKEVLLERDNLINILGSMEDGVYIANRNYDIEYVNPILTKEFGPYEGKKCHGYFHDREEICPWCKNQEVFKGKTVRWEWYSAKNQKTYDLIDTPLKNVDGSVSKLELFRDITERKNAEKKLKESEEKYKSLFEQFPTAILLINFKGVIEDCNTSTVGLFGYTKEELLGIDYLNFDIFPPDTKTMLAQSFSKFLKTGVPEHSELQLSRKDGKMIWINAYPIVIKIAGTFYILAMLQDITQSKTSEEEIRYQAKIIDNMSEGLYLIKLDDGTIVYANPAFEEMFGYDPGEMMGKNVAIVNAPTDKTPEETRNKIVGILKDTRKWHGEVLNVKKDGTRFWCYANVSLFDHPDYGRVIISMHTDITERKEKEEEIRLHSEIMTNMSEGVYLVRLEDLIIVYANPRFEQMFGYDPGEMVGKDVVMVNAPTNKTPEETKNEIVGLIKDTGEWHGEVLNVKKDGTPFWCYANVSVFDHPEYGRVIISIHTDITERKEMDQIFKESQKKYKLLSEELELILDHIGNPVFYKDTKNSFIWVNKYLTDAYKMKREDLIGKSLFDLFPEDVAQTYWDDDLEVINSGKPKLNIEEPWETTDGLKWVLTSKIPYIDEIGNIKGIIGTSVNITERVIAKKKLLESEAKHRGLLETAVMGIVEFDVIGNKVSYINPKLLEILGYAKEDLLDEKTFMKIIHPEDLEEQIKSSEDKYVEFRIFTKEGKLKWLSGTMNNLFNKEGKLISTRLWLQDSTESKEVEEIKNNLMTRFSHEFKTPLISIKGFADFLLTEHDKNLDDKTISFLKKIKNGGDRLKELVNSFIESSQLDKALIKLKLHQENLSDLIKTGLEEMQGLINLRAHTINLDIHDQLIASVDKEKIYSVITNLLLNAINYTSKGGKIWIQSIIYEGSIIVSVKDNGIGLDDIEKKQLFKPFGKIERYGKGWDIISEGMGMGLYLS